MHLSLRGFPYLGHKSPESLHLWVSLSYREDYSSLQANAAISTQCVLNLPTKDTR